MNRIVYRADDEMEKFYRDKATQSCRGPRAHASPPQKRKYLKQKPEPHSR